MQYLQFDFAVNDGEVTEALIALLAEIGFEGFEEGDGMLSAFIPSHQFVPADFGQTISVVGPIDYTQKLVDQVNWNAKWESDFQPVRLDDFVAIRAGFHPPEAGVAHEIVITPKMSFGTGHHATTMLMMDGMRSIEFTGKRVLDFGTGTGILAILASKLGAASVFAIDCDQWSIENATENLFQNGCKVTRVEQADTLPADESFDIVLANINLNVLIGSMAAIADALEPGGQVLLSGILANDTAALTLAIEGAGLHVLSTAQRGDWMRVMAKKTGTVKISALNKR